MEGKEGKTTPEEKAPNLLDLMEVVQASLKQLKPLEEIEEGRKTSENQVTTRSKRTVAKTE
ncbi:hypothetical protein QW71_13675 [Paenibacillus sp. IHB B 3415]|uniref:hypothetical protein n=1 Tax=Paenibacillus sp. IHB B 3415 TaxID=867080 RepID=UPI00057409C6|nr:hypothetical protein [Paenibacillus sp. IHB B 3415]KHL95249.1 hypothetical protein QW71_13675 [Paenibacillus sp. IHB B 3415]